MGLEELFLGASSQKSTFLSLHKKRKIRLREFHGKYGESAR